MAGVNSGYPRLVFWEPLGVAPSVVVAVDDPRELSLVVDRCCWVSQWR